MKYIFSSFLSLLLTSTVLAQKVIYDPNAEVRTVKNFHGIKVSGGIDLYLSSGDEIVAVSAADTKYLQNIKTEVDNGILKIWFEGKGSSIFFSGKKSLKAYVSYKLLDLIAASGGSDVIIEGTVKTNKLVIDISGGSDFKGKVEVVSLSLVQSGGADADIWGTAKTIEVEASGGSDLNGYGLVTDVCTLEASGGSDITITANKELSAEASGASDIRWAGAAIVKKANASGAGSVSRKG